MNALVELGQFGQSAWLDYIRRTMITSGELLRFIEKDGLGGVTSNPAIFEKAISGSNDYNNEIASFVRQENVDAKAIYEHVAVQDLKDAADVLYGVYQRTNRKDGYVSLEVSPYLARDTEGTLAEARRLWRAVGRDNVMIKVPATPQGVPAIETLISEGININVTLLFAQSAYETVAEAYIRGLEALAKKGGDVSRVASVASFFVSRIDSNIDGRIAQLLATEKDAARRKLLEGVQGKVAIANARLAYQSFRRLLETPRWKALAAKGAMPQRMLWASTSTKNPKFRDVIYVEELIGPDTVDTLPPATFEAFRDHGKARVSIEDDLAGARATMENMERAGISMKAVTEQLLEDGVVIFAEAFDRLLAVVEHKRQELLAGRIGKQTQALPKELNEAVIKSLEEWRVRGNIRRLWARDASVWTNKDESQWLGWLDIVAEQTRRIEQFKELAAELKSEGFAHILLLGMGGSSLCPDVLKLTFGRIAGHPELHVLDSTDPAQVRAFEKKVDLKKTICIVSSKSGSTLEPNIFKQYFLERMAKAVGAAHAGRHFIAVTDPGSKMEEAARADNFRHIFHGWASIGGRYSALSDFGMVPLAAMGLDAARFLARTMEMVNSCAPSVPPAENPGVVLGTILGVLSKQGRDKLTFVTSPALQGLGAWLEQLIAESTGKDGKGIVPVDRENAAAAAAYGNDRLFVYTRLDSAPDAGQDKAVDALEKGGHPVVRIRVPEPYCIGQEFFRWEIATSVAGAVIGINPFNQPDVEASKIETKKLTTEYEKTGALPAEQPFFTGDGIKLFADRGNAAALGAGGATKSLAGVLGAFFDRMRPGDYFGLLAYVEMTAAHEGVLGELRHLVRDAKKVATCLGFGPRFLHSTGQAYKGGPNSGVFLQITCDDAEDVAVPGQKYTFGVVKAAQARGDFEVLVERGRRALRVHLPKDVGAGLRALLAAARQALAQVRVAHATAPQAKE
ncbi:MAG: bifunctional transaldolase/phosoglucose isomerase [Planctomycetes bacterium]|nr:bifunctional transaldolase/phosoglucose isomerase [Planctomycetota bacterium]